MLPEMVMPCIPVFDDNEGAIQITKNPVTNSNSKHIGIRRPFITKLVARKMISVIHVASEFEHADFITKVLLTGYFTFYCNFALIIM